MRTLVYKVKDQRIIRSGDHSGLVAGTKGYLRAQFKFDKNWDDCMRVASFFYNDVEYAKKIDKDGFCEIPPEVLIGTSFELSIEGRKPGYCILTGRIKEYQNRGDK